LESKIKALIEGYMQKAEKKMDVDNWQIDKSWTLFLDRDGVINKRIIGDYVKNWKEFEFITGALESFGKLSKIFGKIIVVTNQQGIGKKLMTNENFNELTKNMRDEVRKNSGKIDAVYFCPHKIEDNCECRKPKTGMLLTSLKNFPDISFKRSIIIGDSEIDMEFGKKLGLKTIFIENNNSEKIDISLYDQKFPNLLSFTNWLDKND
jgi:histidinol-phosphate phosphatase family protein